MSIRETVAVLGAAWVLAWVLGAFPGSARAADPPQDAAAPATPATLSNPSSASKVIEEVVVQRSYDRSTLEQVIIPRFVISHSAPAAATGQLARWRIPVCPRIIGTRPEYAEYVTERILQHAQNAGAPTAAAGKTCEADIEILFTPAPQRELDGIAQKYPRMLGSARRRGDTTMSLPIQAWYLTGTRSTSPQRRQTCGSGAVALPDPEWGNEAPVCGEAGSRITRHMESELMHVLVIVDAGKLAEAHLAAVADYIAMIALSRVGSQEACSELPSIMDLLSPGCTERAAPEALTAADGALLRALYHADLESNLSFEQADIREHMLGELAGH